ncbi:MAG: terminase [Oscillospiraceae bacterium]|nr:terminase [Oscillospiraceae bacterium]
MGEPRRGRQTPTRSVVLPYDQTYGQEAIDLYNSTGRTAQEWQEIQMYDILAVNEEGLWVHTKYGYAVPRRNGKNEIVAMREIYGLTHGEKILHTAHRTTTSASASKRLAALLSAAGYTEVARTKKDEIYDKHYTYSKQMGLECITILGEGGGSCSFRTRSSKGGLGEGFDLLVIDEAQEYQDAEESALKYVVSDSRNPQTIFCGTPPTPVSSGTVFLKLRNGTLQGEMKNAGWAEWSVDEQVDPNDREKWYETNPSLGSILTERKILDEIGSDHVDFNIQRLGLWLRYNQKSAISKAEWEEQQCTTLPKFTGKLFVGIKYGHEGDNVAMSVAVKTAEGKIFVEAIDCKSMRVGNGWILDFLSKADIETVVVDGANGQQLLADGMKKLHLKQPLMPTVKQVIVANAAFAQGLYDKRICHMGQPSLVQVVSNCEKRAIGTNGGFGYKAILDGARIELMDSMILAFWSCSEQKEKRKQTISY